MRIVGTRGEPFLFTNIALSVSIQGSLVGRAAQLFVCLACDLLGRKKLFQEESFGLLLRLKHFLQSCVLVPPSIEHLCTDRQGTDKCFEHCDSAK